MKRTEVTHFTLIELLVVMAIGAMLVALGLPAFNKIAVGNAVNNAASSLKGGLEQTQSTAITTRRRTALLLDLKGKNTNGLPAIRSCHVESTGDPKIFSFLRYTEGSKWIVLGKGVVVAGASFNSVNPAQNNKEPLTNIYTVKNQADNTFPHWAIVFSGYGALAAPAKVTEIIIAEGFMNGDNIVYTNLDPDNSGKPGNMLKLQINPFTGKVKI